MAAPLLGVSVGVFFSGSQRDIVDKHKNVVFFISLQYKVKTDIIHNSSKTDISCIIVIIGSWELVLCIMNIIPCKYELSL